MKENMQAEASQNETVRGLTYGEKAVGITFNLSGDPAVTKLKGLYAEIINILNECYDVMPSEKARLAKIAITEAQGAQMWAVKACTWKD